MKNNIEKFVSYKKNVIQLTPETHIPIIISVGYHHSYYSKFAELISKIYPLEIKYHDGASYKNVENLINNKCELSICQVDTAVSSLLGTYPFKKTNNNIRYVCSLYMEIVTLIVSPRSHIYSWKDLKNKVVCIGKKSFSSYYNFLTLSEIAGFDPFKDIKIIEDNIFSKDIIKKFSNGQIDALYITTPHPKKELYELYIKIRYRIIGTKGLDNELIKLRMSEFKKDSIDLNNYNMGNEQGSMMTYSIGVPSCIITRDDVPDSYIYKFVKTIFTNIGYIKSYPTNLFFKKTLEEVLPSQILSLNFLLRTHTGALSYYKDIGIITYNPHHFCANFAGSGICNLNPKNLKHFGHGSTIGKHQN